MRAVIKKPVAENRQNLNDIIPLSAPFTILLEPTRYCNFKCYYCMHSTKGIAGGEWEQSGFRVAHIEDDLRDKIINDIMEFSPQPRRILIAGLGEPLMYQKLPDMIKSFRIKGFTGQIEIITNGSLLVPEMSDRLLEAGVSKIRISLQGLTDEAYLKNAGIHFSFQKIIDNVSYFYQHKSADVELYVKIMNTMLETKEDENRFYQLFGDICDSMYVENLIVSQQEMAEKQGDINNRNVYNEEVDQNTKKICAIINYKLQVNLEGTVLPCDISGLSPRCSFGDINQESLVQIWNGTRRINMICTHLRGERAKIPVCSTCTAYPCIEVPEENIDSRAEELLERYQRSSV